MVKKISKLCFSFLMISVFMFSSIDCQASSVFQDVYGDCSDEQEVEPVTFDDVNVDSPELDVPDYLGAHNVPLSEAYSTINIVDRYFIY